jgi:AraC-like DNA-binding protein
MVIFPESRKQDLVDLVYNPRIGAEQELLLPVPDQLKGRLLSWMEFFYRRYSFGYSLVQRFNSRRFSIHFWYIQTNEAGKLYPVSDKPTIAIQAMLEGEIPCILSGFGEKLLTNSKYELFYIPVSTNEAWLEPGTYESFHIELEDGFLEDIAESYPRAKDLLLRFNNASEQGTPMISVSMSYGAKIIINNIRECDKKGGDLTIMLHRYVVDLLSEYINGIIEQEGDQMKKAIPHKDIFMRIKQEVLSDPSIARQKLKKLSKKYGVSITELKKGFKDLFNNTPGSFIRFHALNKAHNLITTTQQGIDDIAEEVGYGYRSNFDKAFKKLFGYAPASLR